MKTLHKTAPLTAELKRLRCPVGFVPTMGALHRGHARLIRQARRECASVVVSIFVNPLQFGPKEDLAKYPRTLKADLRVCRAAGADLVFAPSAEELLERTPARRVRADAGLKRHLCGPFRPGHFDGVTTIVAHLFRIVRPDRAYFGLKDYQQFRVIEAMTRRTFGSAPVIVPVPTIRERSGLAMSSRNRYLSGTDRRTAALFFKALEATRRGIRRGAWKTGGEAEAFLRERLAEPGAFRVQYAGVYDARTLEPVRGPLGNPRLSGGRPLVVAGALLLNGTRLIDNVLV